MRVTVERQKGSTGSDAWLATLEASDAGYTVKLTASGETAQAARKSLGYKFTELSRRVAEALDQ